MSHHQGPASRRNEWLHFFLGTPRRALWTAFGLFVLFAMIAPHAAALALSNAVNAIIIAFGPSLGALLQIAIAFLAIWYCLIKPFQPRKAKKKDGH